MGSELNLSVKPSVTIDTMLNFEGDFDGHRHGNGTCKQTLTLIMFFFSRLQQPMPGQYNYPGANVPGVPGVPTQMPEGMTPLQQQIWMKAFGGGIPGMTGMQ